ncbi:hypothetical protein D9613_004349 [Agrocybe pediades]|uniref:Uncharacterized protein n=1 Tax=Agrocybe pediades TaxID=84607 RepID=A0A8H4QJ43_9AGAR|nr:hypothetical protein D9613_004349 [Agrocybe pediades]
MLTIFLKHRYSMLFLTDIPGNLSMKAITVISLPQILHPLYRNLDADIQKKAREIMNSSQNMVAIPGPIDSSKGIAIREVLERKTVEPRPDRDQYMALSYPTARHTAEKLDELFKPLFRDNENVTFHSMLHEVMEKAGILEEGQPSPPESDGKESGPSSPARQSSASKESSGKSGVNIRPHSPVASCSKLPGASSKASLENISLKVVRENKEHDEHIVGEKRMAGSEQNPC